MNRTDRLMAIIWLLRTRSRMTAAQLSQTFEISIRTIYRDVDALCEAGVPVVALPGLDGGYMLPDTYRLTPVAFSAEELDALSVAGMACAQLGLPALRGALESALAKILAMAPPERAEAARTLSRHVAIDFERRGAEAPDCFEAIRTAVRNRTTLQITYSDISGRATERMLTPEQLLFRHGAWYVQGADSRSGESRTFRLDRITSWMETDAPPVAVAAASAEGGAPIPVRIRMTAVNARWYQEHPVFRAWAQSADADGCLTLAVPPQGISSLLAAVLAFGGQEVILEPAWLAEQLVATAKGAIDAHTP